MGSTVRRRLTGHRQRILEGMLHGGPTRCDDVGASGDDMHRLARLGWVGQESPHCGVTRRWTITPAGRSVLDARGRREELHVQPLTPTAQIPTKAHADDAGWDLYVSEARTVEPGGWCDVPCGVAVAVPPGYFTRITGRSSTFRKRGLLTVEGIIDAGFRGELFSCVYNTTAEPVVIEPGERLAQLLIHRVEAMPGALVGELPPSARGTNGFGSSGR